MGGCGARMEISRNLGMGSGRAAGRCPVVGLTAATKSAPGLLGPGASGSPLLTLSLCVLGWDSGLEFEAIGSMVAATLPTPPPQKKAILRYRNSGSVILDMSRPWLLLGPSLGTKMASLAFL